MTISNALPTSQQRRAGIFLMLLSALFFSTAGLFTKGVEASSWDVVFWRGLFAALVTTLFILARGKGRTEFGKLGRPGLLVTFLMTIATPAFIAAFKHTDVANVALIFAAAPVVAAVLAWVWMREAMGRWVLLGCVLSFSGVSLIVGGSLGGLNLTGDLLAAWMTVIMASVMVVYRRFPDTPGAGPMVISSLLLLPVAALFGNPFQTALHEIGILAAFGIVFALGAVMLNEAAKRLPSGQAGLLSTSEAGLAPLLAWLVLAEIPSWATALGGGLIVIGVIAGQRVGSK